MPQSSILSCMYLKCFSAAERSDILFAASTARTSVLTLQSIQKPVLGACFPVGVCCAPAKAFPAISPRFKDTFVNAVGHRAAERSLQLGLLHSVPEAHRMGLVDEVVPEEKLQEKAAAVMAQWLALPGKGGTSCCFCCPQDSNWIWVWRCVWEGQELRLVYGAPV